MKTIYSFLLLIALIIPIKAQNADLKLNLEKNKVYRFRSNSEQTITQTVNGMQQNTEVKNTSAFSLKMIDSSPEFIIAEVGLDTLITTTNAMGRVTVNNSTLPGDITSSNTGDVMSCILNRLSKNKLYVKISYTGKVIQIVNAAMLSEIILADTASITGQMAPILKTQVKSLISEKTLTSLVASFLNFLPGKTVAPGDQWSISETTNSGGMAFDVVTNYQLNNLSANSADITAESNIQASANAGPMKYGAATINYGEVKGFSKSSLKIDPVTGLLLETKANGQITGNLNVNAQGTSLQIPMQITLESTATAVN